MNDSTKAVVRVEYEVDGLRKVCYGEIDETKLETFLKGGQNFISMENDGNITWVDKESLFSVGTLGIKSTILLKPRIVDYTRANTITDKGICF